MKFNSQTGAIAGRKSTRKGVMNAENKLMQQKLNLIIERNIEQIEEDLKSLEPKDRLNILVKLIEFRFPKLTRAQVEQEAQEININFSNKW
ncbi:MAG: hypothetical protein AAF600_17275 [Bacteroidota bacterium]